MSTTEQSKPLLSLAEAAKQTGIDVKTWRLWISQKKVAFTQPGGPGGKVFVSAETVARMIEQAKPAVTVNVDGYRVDVDGYPLNTEDNARRAMLADPDLSPDFTFDRTPMEFLSRATNPVTGRLVEFSWAMKPHFERYIAALLRGESNREARESSGYNNAIDVDAGWD